MLRKTLLASRELRYLYLQALLIYHDEDEDVFPKTKKTKQVSVQDTVLISSIRPQRPTNEDICKFPERHWPSIHISHTGSSKNEMACAMTYVLPEGHPKWKISYCRVASTSVLFFFVLRHYTYPIPQELLNGLAVITLIICMPSFHSMIYTFKLWQHWGNQSNYCKSYWIHWSIYSYVTVYSTMPPHYRQIK